MLELHRQATARGWVSGSEADRLGVVGAAEHALAAGRSNPAGLFAHLVRGRLWRYLTGEDEDRANARIRREVRGVPAAGSFAAGIAVGPGRGPAPSADAATVREVRASLIRAGHLGDPFEAFRRHAPGWTRERWDRAWAEASGGESGWR